MQVSGFWSVLSLGILGGILVEVLRWWKLRESPALPTYARSPFYWSISVVMILAGGVLATLYGVEARNAIMVVNLGAAAPALIGALAVPSPSRESKGPGESAPPDSVARAFLSFRG